MTETGAVPLTDRQRLVLCVIAMYVRVEGEVPSTMFIARRLSLHHSTVQQHLTAAHRKGFLSAPVPGPLVRPLPPLPVLPIPPLNEDD